MLDATIKPPEYYIPEIGPRLKPSIRHIYQKWTDLLDDALLSHLHNIVSASLLSS